MLMFSTNIAQTTASFQVQSDRVYEYALTVSNSIDNDIQELVAAFTFIPSLEDWQQWLSGWFDCGYSLNKQPVLIRTI